MSTVEKKPYIHLSIDDTFEIFKDLAQNAMYYSSIFENPYLHFLEMLHTQYGLVASMYCFTEEGDFSVLLHPRYGPEDAARGPGTTRPPGRP